MHSKLWSGVLVMVAALMGAAALAQTGSTPSVNREEIAQNIAMVELDEVVASRLDQADRSSGRFGARYEDYAIRLNSNAVLEIEMTGSPELTVTVFQTEGGRDDLLLLGRSGIAVAGGDSPVTFVVRNEGLYVVRVYGPDQTAYSIAFKRAQVQRPEPIAVSIGQTANGSLADGGPRTTQRNLFRDYVLRAEGGNRLGIRATAASGSDLDLYLEIGSYLPNNVLDVSKFDDDFGDTLDPYILAVMPASGELIVRVRGFSEQEAGAYTLSVQPLPEQPRSRSAPRQLRAERVYRDTLSMADEMLGPESFLPVKYYEVRGASGETYSIDMQSARFQPVITVGVITPVGFTAYQTTDGSVTTYNFAEGNARSRSRIFPAVSALWRGATGGNTRQAVSPSEAPENTRTSALRFRMPASGRMLVRVTTQEEGAEGAFDLIARAVPEVELVAAGNFTADIGECEMMPSGIERCSATNTRFRLPPTTTIEARQGARFGVNIRLTGVPGESSTRQLRQVWRFPAPGLAAPSVGAPVLVSERTVSILVDSDYFATFGLTHPWEVVPGTWTLEFWDENNERIFVQQFTVRPSAPAQE